MSRHSNLSNPNSEPDQAPIDVTCSVHFDMYGAVPKAKLQTWLISLPEEARVTFEGTREGKAHFAARWTETR